MIPTTQYWSSKTFSKDYAGLHKLPCRTIEKNNNSKIPWKN